MNTRTSHVIVLLLFIATSGYAQRQHSFSFDSLFKKYPQSFDSIIAHKEDYRLQLIYTRIDRDAGNIPKLTTYSYDADRYYYYCASMMKLPACALTLEKLNNLTKYRVTMLDSLGIDTIACTDLSPESMMLGTPYSCLSQYIKEMLLVSNNNAFNPVYDFLGQYDFQQRLHDLGYRSAVISNRYAGCDTNANRLCAPVSLYDRQTHMVRYTQPCTVNQRRQLYEGELSPLVGNGYLGGGTLINEPKSFRFSNYIKLSELHRLLTRIIFPETESASERLNLTHNDYQYLYKCMGMFPRECAYPAFDSIHYPDNYMKYFIGIDTGTYTMPSNIRVFNKVGQAYGFMTDCSYVIDTLNKVEFFLSCSMYLNADGILNDGKYEYDSIGYPFFHNIFNAVYTQELTRHKSFTAKLQLPDFSDTLLVKPRPSWLRLDSTKSIEKMEAVLCSLADSMAQDRKLFINYDSPTSEEIFYRNLSVALRARAAGDYPFDALRQKDISIISSDDKKLRTFSWEPMTTSNFSLLQYKDSAGKTLVCRVTDIISGHPATIFTKAYQLKAKHELIYLFINQTANTPTGHSVFLDALAYRHGQLVRVKIFKLDPHTQQLYESAEITSRKAKDKITYDPKRQTLIMTRSYQNKKSRTHKLKFDGAMFK